MHFCNKLRLKSAGLVAVADAVGHTSPRYADVRKDVYTSILPPFEKRQISHSDTQAIVEGPISKIDTSDSDGGHPNAKERLSERTFCLYIVHEYGLSITSPSQSKLNQRLINGRERMTVKYRFCRIREPQKVDRGQIWCHLKPQSN